MRKIMFNDKYGLTEAVLAGRKTITRRIIPELVGLSDIRLSEFGIDDRGKCYITEYNSGIDIYPKYQVGEVVAVAQNLRDMGYNPRDTKHKPGEIWGFDHSPAWTNKMFVSASECIHQISITNVRVERLHDISDEDCIREGIEEDSPYYWVPVNMSLPNWRKTAEGVSDMYPNDRDGKVYPHFWDSPRKAFAALIDKVSGKGTFGNNPWVFVYGFELVK